MPRSPPSFLLKRGSGAKPNYDEHCTVVVANGFAPQKSFSDPSSDRSSTTRVVVAVIALATVARKG